MSTPPPPEADLLAVAERALRHAGPDAQATVSWERTSAIAEPLGVLLRRGVAITAVRDGRAATVVTEDLEPDALDRAARGALRAAEATARREGSGPDRLPSGPSDTPARAHDGWDPRLLGVDPVDLVEAADTALAPIGAAEKAIACSWRTSMARVAIASASGVRASESRSLVRLDLQIAEPVNGRSVERAASSTGPDDIDIDALAQEVIATLGGREVAPSPEIGPCPVVLGSAAVAQILALLTPHLGPLAATGDGVFSDRQGTRVVAPAINLSDSPRFPGTLPRSLDAEGTPRRPVPLIQDGVAHRRVFDTVSGAAAGTASTGHATRAGRFGPQPEHLVLVGGGAEDEKALAAGIGRGVFIPGFTPTGTGGPSGAIAEARCAWTVENGEIARPLAPIRVLVDPVAVLAAVTALAARSRRHPHSGASALTVGATVCPALSTTSGVEVLPTA